MSKNERSKSKTKSAKGGNDDTFSKKSKISKKARIGVLPNKNGDDNGSVKKSMMVDDDKKSILKDVIQSEQQKASGNEEDGEGEDKFYDNDLDEIAPHITRGAHL